MNYRQEIDGLRTIAVMAVVAYHAAFALGDSIWLSGGYIGVDVFFVISGYLITRIIIQKEVDDRFSLRDFYIGRIRRIVPALAVMVLLVGDNSASNYKVNPFKPPPISINETCIHQDKGNLCKFNGLK